MTKIFCDKCEKEITVGGLITVSISAHDPEYPLSTFSRDLCLCYDCGKAMIKDQKLESEPK